MGYLNNYLLCWDYWELEEVDMKCLYCSQELWIRKEWFEICQGCGFRRSSECLGRDDRAQRIGNWGQGLLNQQAHGLGVQRQARSLFLRNLIGGIE